MVATRGCGVNISRRQEPLGASLAGDLGATIRPRMGNHKGWPYACRAIPSERGQPQGLALRLPRHSVRTRATTRVAPTFVAPFRPSAGDGWTVADSLPPHRRLVFGAQAAGAEVHSAGLAVSDYGRSLDVGEPAAARLPVGVAYVVAGLAGFAAIFTFCHAVFSLTPLGLSYMIDLSAPVRAWRGLGR